MTEMTEMIETNQEISQEIIITEGHHNHAMTENIEKIEISQDVHQTQMKWKLECPN